MLAQQGAGGTAAASFLVSALLTLVMVRGWLPIPLPVDAPNSRSLHARPTPRCGGLAIMLSLLLIVAPQSGGLSILLLSTIGLSIVSLLDDIRNLPVAFRLASHFAAALILVAPWSLALPWLFGFVVLIVACTNAYNFMDGANGLAGGAAVIGFGMLAFAGNQANDMELSGMAITVAAASAGFLLFNFGKGLIFLGDSGSIPLGFLAGSLGILGWIKGDWPPQFPIMVFLPLIVDSSLTLIRRALRGEIVWRAHREHYYQRLIQLGWSHQRVALAYYGIMLIGGGVGLVTRTAPSFIQWGSSVVFLSTIFLLARITDRLWERR